MKKRYWAVRCRENGILLRDADGQVYYSDSKRAAKIVRNQASANTNKQHIVVLGPDHRRYARC